ncbi:Uncharacterised protein [Shigella sonnei]|nr:Uncharacterised protein [Shigella sonnei]
MVDSLIKTLIAISTIPLVIWFMKKQYQKVEIGKFDNEGWSWEEGKPKYKPTCSVGKFYYCCSNQYDMVKNLVGT